MARSGPVTDGAKVAGKCDGIYEQAWQPAYDADREPRPGAGVLEVTGLPELSRWPKGMRVIVRRERPHPGAQLRPTDRAGHRLTGFATNTAPGGPGRQLADLELRHPPRRRPHPWLGWTTGAPTSRASSWRRCPGWRRRPLPGWPTASARCSGRRWKPGLVTSPLPRWPCCPPDRAAALWQDVTIDLDTTDVEVYGRDKRGVAFNHQGQRVARPRARCTPRTRRPAPR
jgi:hypothetical protein